MKMKTKTLISSVLLAAIFACWGWFIYSHSGDFARILSVSPAGLLLLFALAAFAMGLRGMVLKEVTAHLGVSLSLGEALQIVAATTFLNYLPMKAGVGTQAVYLKFRHKLPYAGFLACFAVSYLASFVAVGILGLIISGPVWAAGKCNVLVPVSFSLLLLGCLLVLAIPGKWHYAGKSRLLRGLSETAASWQQLRSTPLLLARIAAINLPLVIFGGLRLYVCFVLLGYDVPVYAPVLMSLIAYPLHLISIVPGTLGIREAGIAALGLAFGQAIKTGVVAATLDRAAIMVVVFVWGPIASFSLLKQKRGAET